MSKASAKTNPRRQEAHRLRAGDSPGFLTQVRRAGGLAPMAVALAFLGAVFVVSQLGGETIPYRVGQNVENDILSRVSFDLQNTAETERRHENARRTSPNVYMLNLALLDGIRAQLNQLLSITKTTQESYEAFAAAFEKAGLEANEEVYAELKSRSDDQASAEYSRWVDTLLTSLRVQYVVTPVERTAPIAQLWDEPQGRARNVDISLLQPASNAGYVEQMASDVTWQFPTALQPIVRRIIVRSIQVDPEKSRYEPIHTYDPALTNQIMEERVRQVEPVTVPYEAGTPLVRAGKLTAADLLLLEEEQRQFRRLVAADSTLYREQLLARIGMFGVLLAVVVGLSAYTVWYDVRMVHKLGRCVGLAILLSAMLLLSRLLMLRGFDELAPATVAVAAALLTILYNQRYSLGVVGIQSLLTCLVTDERVGSLVTMVGSGWMFVFLLREIRTRSKVISTGITAGVVGFLLTVAFGLVGKQDLQHFVLAGALRTGGGILLVGFIVQGVLPLIERVFGIATSMTLLEWCDASRPLLRRLAQEAPGSYNHSLIISNMAESAATVIGANGLLTRVGALYHDIGKIAKPDYFTENQQAKINRHDKLSPTMSLMIIRGHVKDGIEMAREYGLPRVLHPFIQEHHGTTLVKYFLRVASEQQSGKAVGKHDRQISESEFRYPGPKPRSREAAILMICDGAEGTVRALSEPSATRIEIVVHKLVMDRLTDGQFDSCGITMQELHQVEESVVKSLRSIHHGRIAYPKDGQPMPASPTEHAEEEEEEETLGDAEAAPAPEETPDGHSAEQSGPSTPIESK